MKSAANSRHHSTLGSFRLPLVLFSTIAFLTIQLPLYAQDNSDNWMSSIRQGNKASLVFISGKVTHKNGDAAPFSGTGFIVSSLGHVLTCNHVIPAYDPDVDTLQCSGSVGGRYELLYPLRIVDSEKQGDLMLLTLPQEKTWTSVRSRAKWQLDSEIVVLGFPIDEPLLAAPGRITSVDNNGRLITNAALNHGMSGGPAFDKSGAIIGIAEGGYEEANSINLLIPMSYATRLLQIADSPLLNPNPASSSSNSSPPSVVTSHTAPVSPQTGARELVIKTNNACDLQGGRVLENANDDQGDFRWLEQSDGKRFLEPSSSSSVVMNLHNRAWDDMPEDPLRSYSASVGTTFQQRQPPTRTTLSLGDLCIYRTRDGGYGKFKVKSCDSDLKIEFITYYVPKVSQQPPNSGDITVRPNRFCNLDDGQQVKDNSGGEATFEWYYREDIEKGLLVPNNLSAFALMGVGKDFFNNLSVSTIKSLLDTVASGQIKLNGSSFSSTSLIQGNVYGYRTRSGLYGKLLIDSVGQDLGVRFATFQ
jgi:S1-C subfamily serine protease